MAYEKTDDLLALASHHWYKYHDGNLYKLFDIYEEGMQAISTASEKTMKWRAIQDAEGTTLDLFGKDIETYRPTKDDEAYRFMIRLKVLLSKAQGTVPSIVKIISTAIGNNDGISIKKTDLPRHVAITIPYDYVADNQIEKFLINNLQNMLALGYWVDAIVFYSNTSVTGYLGTAIVDHTDNHESMNSIWWTGWQATTYNHWYFGTDIATDTYELEELKAI